jgi:hypothetical protein
METKYNRRRTDRQTIECPIVRDEAVDGAVSMMFKHEPNDYIDQQYTAQLLRTTRELDAIPDLELCA